jgi:hypothetical protein
VNQLQSYILDELNVKKLTLSTDKHQVTMHGPMPTWEEK